jgi:transcriptional regulator with XRE-family HTH domain
MSNIITGRQLRAACILAGLTQKQLAKAVGVHERAARYWELKKSRMPISAPQSLERVEAVLLTRGVIAFASPTPGVRLASFPPRISRPEANPKSRRKWTKLDSVSRQK